MLSVTTLVVLTICYLLLLFAIAFIGDKYTLPKRLKPIVYSLGLGVYCTSWAFYGVTGQAAETGWWLTPTYTGAILVFVFAWPVVLKVARICREQSLTSLADFIASRYGKSSKLAGLITLTSVVAIVPYIALQLRAITNSFESVTQANNALGSIDITLVFTLMLAVFAILFGTRRIRPSEHNPGLLLAIAFESLIKLFTFLLIGFFVCFVMFDGIEQFFQQASTSQAIASVEPPPSYVYVTQTLLGVLMMFCLPRQFHMAFIEQDNAQELNTARWLFPVYMLLMNIFALPIAYAGIMLLQGQGIGSDTFMLQLPMMTESSFMTLVAFLGGFSAATSMVIVATIVLSIMVSNDLITPKLLAKETDLSTNSEYAQKQLSPGKLLIIRRITIVVILLLAYAYYQVASNTDLLAVTGLMAMALVAQFSPSLLLGLVWRRANHQAAYRSIWVGSAIWGYCLLLPSMNNAFIDISHILEYGLFGWQWLKPTAMFGIELDFISHGVFVSLAANVSIFIYYSLRTNPNVAEQLQAVHYLNASENSNSEHSVNSPLTIQDLNSLVARFFGGDYAKKVIDEYYQGAHIHWQHVAPAALEAKAEQELSGIIGGASAKLLLDSAKRQRHALLNDVVDIVDEASELLRFNRTLLQATIQNVNQGISVVDKELKLVAWNRRYIEMFDYPEEEIFVGRPVAEIIRFNAKRGLFGKNEIDQEVDKRIAHLKNRQPYRFQRVQANSKVYEMNGNPMLGGGFVTTYSDITEFVNTQKALEEINAHLETRVEQRTADLTALNDKLQEAKQDAEQANVNKTRYFAALSHDLLQPFNAASLFASILKEKSDDNELQELTQNIAGSLENAEQLLKSILELTKLDAGSTQAVVEDFNLAEFLRPICEEFEVLAANKGLRFNLNLVERSTRSDKKLLRRIFQNLLSNALRYTETGEINLFVTEQSGAIKVAISDTGVGIRLEDQQRIFNDFEQVAVYEKERGLGLGLAIVTRIGKILGIEFTLESKLGQGSTFGFTLPLIKMVPSSSVPVVQVSTNKQDLLGVSVLVIDNDLPVLNAMKLRLQAWGCQVITATNYIDAKHCCDNTEIDLIIADYHLDDGEIGVDLVQRLFTEYQRNWPVIFNSADYHEEIREKIVQEGYVLLNKPVKPAALKRAIKQAV